MLTPRAEVYQVLDLERQYQNQKWANGDAKHNPHSVSAWILFMEHHLQKARTLASTSADETPALHEIRKVTALGVVTMEQHGAPLR